MNVPVPAVMSDNRIAPAQLAASFRASGQPVAPWLAAAIRRPVVDRFGSGLGMMQCDQSSGVCWDDQTGEVLSTQYSGANPTMAYTPSSTTTSSSSLPTNWTPVLQTLTQGALTLGQELALQPGMSISPSGAISQQNPGYPIGTGVATAISGISTTTLLMLGGVAILLFAMKGK